jgi:serine protease
MKIILSIWGVAPMTPVRRTLFVLAACALGVASLGTDASELRTTSRPIQGQYIVVLKDEAATLGGEMNAANRPSIATVAQGMAQQHGAQMRRHFSHALRGFVVQANDRALERLLLDQRVAYVEEDGIIELSATQTNATWGLDRVDQRDLPLSGTYVYNTTASNVNAYIIDTGVLGSHSQFTGRMIGGYTAISDGRGTTDCNGHGTHVAGTVAGTTHGIAKGAKISPVRVLGCDGSGTNSGVIAGMDWVTANHVKPAVANMSLGGGASSATDDAIARMTNAGVIVVVAAGNDNSNACNYSPARAASAITVGSTASNDSRSSFSNYGSCLDIFAPGSSITSAWYTSNTATNTISGTSMASPHVAGVAALYLADNPTASVSQVTNALLNAATPNKVSSAGSGSPNRLLYSLFGGGGGGDTTAPSTPGSLAASAASSSQINLSWSSSTDTGGSGLAGYKVERCSGSSCTNFAQIAPRPRPAMPPADIPSRYARRFARARRFAGCATPVLWCNARLTCASNHAGNIVVRVAQLKRVIRTSSNNAEIRNEIYPECGSAGRFGKHGQSCVCRHSHGLRWSGRCALFALLHRRER